MILEPHPVLPTLAAFIDGREIERAKAYGRAAKSIVTRREPIKSPKKASSVNEMAEIHNSIVPICAKPGAQMSSPAANTSECPFIEPGRDVI